MLVDDITNSLYYVQQMLNATAWLMAELITINEACSLFERSYGCKLHQDPAAGKCKFLALGRWKGTLQQEDIPMNYTVLSDSLEMVGVEVKSSWVQTRKANGDIIQARISNLIGS